MHKTLTALLEKKVRSLRQGKIFGNKNFSHLLAVEGEEKDAQDPYSLAWEKLGIVKQERICGTKNFNHLLAVDNEKKDAQDPYSLTWAKK